MFNAAGDLLSTVDARTQKNGAVYDALGRVTERWTGDPGTGTKVDSYTYDTLRIGHLTSSTRYEGSAAYTATVEGYTDDYQPTGMAWTVPSVEGALAGSYRIGMTYNVYTGAPATSG